MAIFPQPKLSKLVPIPERVVPGTRVRKGQVPLVGGKPGPLADESDLRRVLQGYWGSVAFPNQEEGGETDFVNALLNRRPVGEGFRFREQRGDTDISRLLMGRMLAGGRGFRERDLDMTAPKFGQPFDLTSILRRKPQQMWDVPGGKEPEGGFMSERELREFAREREAFWRERFPDMPPAYIQALAQVDARFNPRIGV